MKEIQIKCKGNRYLNYKEFKNFQGNLKTLTKDRMEKLKKEIIKLGWIAPVFVWNKTEILDGHQRLFTLNEMLKEGYNIDNIPIIDIDAKNKTEAAKILLALNSRYGQITDEGLYEFMNLTGLKEEDLQEIELPDIDIDRFVEGYYQKEGQIDDDEIPEVLEEPITKPGDLYILGNHRLLCGDATKKEDVEKLMDGKKADMVFTDPPYGINYSGGRTQVVTNKGYGRILNDTLNGDDLGNLVSLIFAYNAIAADVYICVSPTMQKPFLDFIGQAGKDIDAVIVWDKGVPGLGYMAYRRQCEFILFVKGGEFKKGDCSDFDLWQISRDNAQSYLHGMQKPVAVSLRAINNSSKSGQTVLDLFLGSGSTLIACEKINRICYGMEIDPHYISVILDRWANYTGRDPIREDGKYWRKVKEDGE